MYAGCVGHWRRWAGIEVAPDASGETEDAKQNERAAACHYKPMRQEICEEGLGSDAACHRHKAGSHPSGIGSLRSEHGTVSGEFSTPVGAVLNAHRTALHVRSAVLYVGCAFLKLVGGLNRHRF